MSSLRLVHSKNHPTRDERGESADASSSTRLQSMMEKLYRLEQSDSNSVDVFDQLVDDLLAEARREEKA